MFKRIRSTTDDLKRVSVFWFSLLIKSDHEFSISKIDYKRFSNHSTLIKPFSFMANANDSQDVKKDVAGDAASDAVNDTDSSKGGADDTVDNDSDSHDSQDSQNDKGKNLSDEERLAIFEGNAKRLRKKLGLDAGADKKPSKKSGEFDEGQLAYLATRGVESDEDVDWTNAELKKHGGTLRELMSNEYFKAQLKSRKEAAAVLDATPKGNRRGGTPPTDSVDYHLAKYLQTGKLPADPEMRNKVVNARLKKETSGRQFSDNPVVGM